MSQEDYTKLFRAIAGFGPQHPNSRIQVSKITSRDYHPTQGSDAVVNAIASGGAAGAQTVSLNVLDGAGNMHNAFCWGMGPQFGWYNATTGVGGWWPAQSE